MSDSSPSPSPPDDAVHQEPASGQDARRSGGKFWIILIAAISLGSIGCMCAFIFLAVA